MVNSSLRSRKAYPMEKRQSLLQRVMGKLDNNMQKNETGPLSYTTHKNKFKMDERPKRETGNHQNPIGSNLFDLRRSNFLLHKSPGARETKANMNYWDFIKIKYFCTAKEIIKKMKGSLLNGRRYLQMTY